MIHICNIDKLKLQILNIFQIIFFFIELFSSIIRICHDNEVLTINYLQGDWYDCCGNGQLKRHCPIEGDIIQWWSGPCTLEQDFENNRLLMHDTLKPGTTYRFKIEGILPDILLLDGIGGSKGYFVRRFTEEVHVLSFVHVYNT